MAQLGSLLKSRAKVLEPFPEKDPLKPRPGTRVDSVQLVTGSEEEDCPAVPGGEGSSSEPRAPIYGFYRVAVDYPPVPNSLGRQAAMGDHCTSTTRANAEKFGGLRKG